MYSKDKNVWYSSWKLCSWSCYWSWFQGYCFIIYLQSVFEIDDEQSAICLKIGPFKNILCQYKILQIFIKTAKAVQGPHVFLYCARTKASIIRLLEVQYYIRFDSLFFRRWLGWQKMWLDFSCCQPVSDFMQFIYFQAVVNKEGCFVLSKKPT